MGVELECWYSYTSFMINIIIISVQENEEKLRAGQWEAEEGAASAR